MFSKAYYVCPEEDYPDPKAIYCSRQFMVEERLVIPFPKPDIEELVEIKTNAEINEKRIIRGKGGSKFFIKGTLSQQILYVADCSYQPVHAAHFTAGFCTFLKVPCTFSIDLIDLESLKILVEFAEIEELSKREIEKCTILQVWLPIPGVRAMYPVINKKGCKAVRESHDYRSR